MTYIKAGCIIVYIKKYGKEKKIMRNTLAKKGDTRRLLKRCLALVLAGVVALPLSVPENTTEKTIHAASGDVIYGDVNSDKNLKKGRNIMLQ